MLIHDDYKEHHMNFPSLVQSPAAQPALEQDQDVLWKDGPHADEQPLVENGDMESGLIPSSAIASTPEKQPLEAQQLRVGEEVTRFFESLSERNTPEPEGEQQQGSHLYCMVMFEVTAAQCVYY